MRSTGDGGPLPPVEQKSLKVSGGEVANRQSSDRSRSGDGDFLMSYKTSHPVDNNPRLAHHTHEAGDNMSTADPFRRDRAFLLLFEGVGGRGVSLKFLFLSIVIYEISPISK